MKTKTTKTKSKKEIVLDGGNPQDYAEWETEEESLYRSPIGRYVAYQSVAYMYEL